jgi:NAD(P)H-flavin reductase
MSTKRVHEMRDGKDVTANPMLTHPYLVKGVQQETYDTFTIELEPKNGPRPLSFLPGQFNMLYVFGVGEVPISICGDPAKPETLVHTTRAVGTVTKAMWKLRRGDLIGVRGPFGTSWPVEEAKGHDVVIVTGGIGLPPLRPSVYYLLSKKQEYGKLFLLYGARTPEDIVYGREIEQWRKRPELSVDVTVDRATGQWRGNVGVVTTLIPKADFDPANTIAMIVGPEIMMRFTIAELQRRGVRDENIYISMERNMKCGFGFCGHCQLGPFFVCKDGPVFRFDRIKPFFGKGEV